MKTRFYYTLAEIFARSESDWNNFKSPFYMKGVNKGFKELIDTIIASTSGFNDDTKTKALMQEYIWPSMCNNNFMYFDVEHEPWIEPVKPEVWNVNADLAQAQKEFAGKVYVWLKETIDKYEKIIDIYDSQKANLLNKLESISVSKFNDTPQNNAIGYDDTHTTNATQVSTQADPASIMVRLNEIRYNWDNIFKSWANDFGRIFQLGE